MKTIHLSKAYILAKACTDYHEFKTIVDKHITGTLETVSSDNEFEVVLKE